MPCTALLLRNDPMSRAQRLSRTLQTSQKNLKERAMRKLDLTRTLAKESDLPMRKAEEIVTKFFETIFQSLVRGDRIEIRGFGSFMVKGYPGYVGRNPKTGEQLVVKPKKLPFFRVANELREGVDSRLAPEPDADRVE